MVQDEEEQAKEATLRKDAIYQQKISAWKRSVQANAAAKKATKPKPKPTKKVLQPAKTVKGVKVVKKAALEEATKKDLLKRGPLECPSEKGPLETQERRPPDQVCQQDLEIRPTTEPNKEPPHGRNNDLRGGDLQDELEHLLEEEEFYNALDDDNSPPGEEVKANEVEEEPRDGPQQGAEGPTEVLPQEWPHHEDVGYTDEPNKQGPARRAEATFDDDENRPEEEQPEGAAKAKATSEPKGATDTEATTEPKETTNNKAPPEPRAAQEPHNTPEPKAATKL